ncbi:MAG: DUF481 domain-containing protein [Opitutaceae bacterium]
MLFLPRRLRRSPRLPLLVFLALLLSVTLHAAPAASDVLVYGDGDRIQGRVISEEGDTIVFRSNRFGELRVQKKQAEVIRHVPALASGTVVAAPPPATPPVAPAPATATTTAAPAAGKPDAELAEERQIVERLANSLRHFFGPWHGRVAFSSQVVVDTSERHSEVLEGRMERKWTGDEFRLDARYEFSSTNDVTSTDLTKGGAYWRHDLTKRWFTIVHPSIEWNQNYVVDSVAADYFLLQHEIGAGRTVWDRPGKKLRLGLAENIYDVWNLSSSGHTSRNVESFFVEAEFKLPWNMKLTERGIRYFSIEGGDSGWESQFELSKKFTENLVLAIRNDVRTREKESGLQDYSSWRLLLGLDF